MHPSDESPPSKTTTAATADAPGYVCMFSQMDFEPPQHGWLVEWIKHPKRTKRRHKQLLKLHREMQAAGKKAGYVEYMEVIDTLYAIEQSKPLAQQLYDWASQWTA